jgi:hypothetical protein
LASGQEQEGSLVTVKKCKYSIVWGLGAIKPKLQIVKNTAWNPRIKNATV